MLDGAQRSICCSSLKTNKKQILRSAQDDMLGGFFSSLPVVSCWPQLVVLLISIAIQRWLRPSGLRRLWKAARRPKGLRQPRECFEEDDQTSHYQ